MIAFWSAVALMSAGAAALVLRRAARARDAGDVQGGRAALLVCLGAPLAAAAAYAALGSPGTADQPHAARVETWRGAPERLGPAEAAAVLNTVAREQPNDGEAHFQLGRAKLAAGDAFGAVRAFERAAALKPRDADPWMGLAQALLALEPPSTGEARRALARAERIDPADADLRYWLGQAAMAEGDSAAGLAQWRALAASLQPGDPRRAALQAEIAAAEAAPAAPDDVAIAGMVDGLAARLRTEPDDPEGWARLARAYAVLGRDAQLGAALTESRRRFAGRPQALAAIEAAAAEGRARSPLRPGG